MFLRPAPLFAHLAAALLLGAGLFDGLFGPSGPTPDAVAEALRPRVASLPLHDDTRALYVASDYVPRWTDFGDQVALYRALAEAPSEGLPASLVHAERLAALVARLVALDGPAAPEHGPDPRAAVLAEADLLLTDGLVRYAHALLGRRVEPDSLHPGAWHATRRPDDARVALYAAVLATDAPAALVALDAARPRHPEYGSLREALARLRAAVPYWAPIPEGDALRIGEHSIRVPHLRGRLAALGYLDTGPNGWDAPEPFRFDSLLAGALARFQSDTERPADSVLTPEVTGALNLSPERALAAVAMNLERLRWLPDDLGDFHVLANLPAYELAVRNVAAEGGWRDALRMPAAIGLADAGSWSTPVLSDSIVSVVFDPTWYVPASIAAASLLPMARADSSALVRQGFRVYEGGAPVDPRAVPWDSVSAEGFRFVQRPGPGNPLGRLKFVMPNRHAVLIHDTNKPGHFARTDRAVSTGCVQASDAPALAQALLGVVNGWPDGAVAERLARWGEQAVPLRQPVPVHFVYLTAWPEGDGRLRLHDDVYGHDAVLAAALGLAGWFAPDSVYPEG